MKRSFRIGLSCLLVVSLLFGNAVAVFAHSGRTDSKGGHKDNKNKSGLGSYHYHCGGYPAHLHDGGYCPYTDVFPYDVSIDVEKNTLCIGEKTTFTAEVYPYDACNTNVRLSCDDTDVIRISGDTITAIGYGTAEIIAESFNGITSSVWITVKEITADDVTITSSCDEEESVYIGDVLCCSATITPENVDNPSVEWYSSDESIATVDQKGNVKTLTEGEVIIYAIAANGVAGEYYIDVKEKYVERVELPAESMEILLQSEHKLQATVTPADATFPEISWSTSDPNVVTVDNKGTIFAAGCGTAVIAATATNGVAACVEIEVTEVVAERVDIIGASSFYINGSGLFKTEIFPADTTIQDIQWTTSDPKIITIDAKGNVKCLAEGIATISAIQKDVTTSIEVEVKVKPVERIEIISDSKTPNKLKMGKTMKLSATAYPSDATYTEIIWESSDTEIATVDNSGNITPKGTGKVVITASTKDGYFEEYEIKVSHTVRSFLQKVFQK